MKPLKVLSLRVVLSGALLLAFLSPALWAQKTPGQTINKKPATAYCDQIPNQIKKDLKTRANQECRTVYHCYECTTRDSGKKTCVPVAVQPDKSALCGVVEPVTASKTEAPQTETLTGGPDFKLDYIATWCFAGGVTLQALVLELPYSGPDAEKQYQYLWTVDGKKVGEKAIVNCISGKLAELTVTQIATGRSHSLRLNINQSAVSPSKPVAAFAKSSCFGKCPAFSVEFYPDGTVHWNGLSNVSPKGKRKATLPASILAQIREKATQIRFFELNDRYPETQIVDAQRTTFFLNIDGREKQVVSILGAPEGLKELDQLFMEIIRRQGWAGEDTGTGPAKPQSTQDAPKN